MNLSRLPHLASMADSSSPEQGAASCKQCTHFESYACQGCMQINSLKANLQHTCIWVGRCPAAAAAVAAAPVSALRGCCAPCCMYACWGGHCGTSCARAACPAALCHKAPRFTFSGHKLVQKMSWLMWPAADRKAGKKSQTTEPMHKDATAITVVCMLASAQRARRSPGTPQPLAAHSAAYF
jgi:hypothetical protein